MADSASPSALLDGRVGAGHKAVTAALLWTLASLVTALAIYGFVYLLSGWNEREAGRLMIGAQKGSYVDLIVAATASRHGHPGHGF